MEIKEKTIPAQQMALINHKGLEEDIVPLTEEIMIWAAAEEVEVAGPPFLINYPTAQADPGYKIFDVGYPIKSETAVDKDKIKVVELLEHKVLSCVYDGPRSDIKKAYDAMVEYSIENKYDIIGSPKEVLLTYDYDLNADDLITEIQFPVIFMG